MLGSAPEVLQKVFQEQVKEMAKRNGFAVRGERRTQPMPPESEWKTVQVSIRGTSVVKGYSRGPLSKEVTDFLYIRFIDLQTGRVIEWSGDFIEAFTAEPYDSASAPESDTVEISEEAGGAANGGDETGGGTGGGGAGNSARPRPRLAASQVQHVLKMMRGETRDAGPTAAPEEPKKPKS